VQSDRPGSGLGLAIASQIVRKMGSELKMSSSVGEGSRFWFEMPLMVAQENDVLQSVQAFAMPEPFGTGKSILIVEGNPVTQDYLNEILSLADFDVIRVKNIDEATKQLHEATFDAVLLTQTLSPWTAWEFLRQLHESCPERTPPVILYTALPPQRPDDFPVEIDFHTSQLKPVAPEKLLEIMRGLFT
jgi:CheY-like chemotaxis protein